jgi:hypothetical protein
MEDTALRARRLYEDMRARENTIHPTQIKTWDELSPDEREWYHWHAAITGESSNGRTTGPDPVNEGSTPSPPAT